MVQEDTEMDCWGIEFIKSTINSIDIQAEMQQHGWGSEKSLGSSTRDSMAGSLKSGGSCPQMEEGVDSSYSSLRMGFHSRALPSDTNSQSGGRKGVERRVYALV